jgi:hypothetical protein
VASSSSGNPAVYGGRRNGAYSVCAGAACQTCEYSVYGTYDHHHHVVFYADLPSLHPLSD